MSSLVFLVRDYRFRPTEIVNGKLSLGTESGRISYRQDPVAAAGTSIVNVFRPRSRRTTPSGPSTSSSSSAPWSANASTNWRSPTDVFS